MHSFIQHMHQELKKTGRATHFPVFFHLVSNPKTFDVAADFNIRLHILLQKEHKQNLLHRPLSCCMNSYEFL